MNSTLTLTLTLRKQLTAAAAAVAVGALLVLSPRTATAQTLYGTSFFDNQLITIDTNTGLGTDVGTMTGSSGPSGLALLGRDFYTYDTSANLVRRLDPTTGAATASFDIGVTNRIGEGDLAFKSNGTGFLFTPLDGSFTPTNDLYRFTLGSSTPTRIGTTSDALSGLAFDPAGTTLYALGKGDGNLYTVSQTDATLTLLGNVGFAVGSPFGAITFSPSGTLYGAIDDNLYTINPTTGAAVRVNPDPLLPDLGFTSVSGIAFQAVPEPSAWALLGAAGLVFLMALARRRAPAVPSRR